MLGRGLFHAVVGLTLAAMPVSALGEDAVIKGKVTLEGKPPAARAIELTANPECKQMRKGAELKPELWVVGKKGELANVCVSIKNPPDKKYEIPDKPVVLDQVGCQYTPHVFAVMAGQKLEVRNSDNTSHNVNMMPKKNKPENFGQAQKGMVKTITLDKPEDFPIKCDVHPWMNCHASVLTHPFFAVTGEDGTYEINVKDLPPGDYELEFAHSTGASATQKITVEAGKPVEVDEVKLSSKKSSPRKR
jgi:plastocyanin